MELQRRQCLCSAAVAGSLLVAFAQVVRAETYPTRPVTLIVPVGAGGSNDVTSRALARATERHLGQAIVIENVAGGGTTIGAIRAVKAEPNGYTLVTTIPSLLHAPLLKKTSYDPTSDFTYIIGVFNFTFGVVVKSDAPWKTFQELLADAKANPGKINYAASGIGSGQHIAMLQIAKQQGIKWAHVPFKSDPEALNALLGGHIHAVATTTAWAPQVDAGELRLLVTWGESRTRRWPSVPTLKETGINVVVNATYGISGPKGMDAKIVAILHDALKKGMEDPSFAATLAQLDEEPFYLSSDDYRDFAVKQAAEKKRIIDELGLKLE